MKFKPGNVVYIATVDLIAIYYRHIGTTVHMLDIGDGSLWVTDMSDIDVTIIGDLL